MPIVDLIQFYNTIFTTLLHICRKFITSHIRASFTPTLFQLQNTKKQQQSKV
ncbi:MAG: hypothetical protein H6Q67_1706 [Firmicutes bacterium]|nr:hypothetical protein [Bacillota bacterium]